MSCPYCGFEVAADGTCSRCGRAESSVSLSGWRPDPTARYEGRYYTAGRPTNRVRNGKQEASDPTGGQMLPDYIELPASRSSIRTTWITTGAVTAIIVMAAAMAWGLLVAHRRPPPPPETGYLAALRDTGLMNQFNSDANAIAHGHQVCRRLEDGEPQQGQPADKIAVDTFCPHFAQGFHVLDTVKVSGIFVLTDSLGAEGIAVDGSSCTGNSGYSDIGPDTDVTVKNGKGEILTTTTLGRGTGGSAECRFTFAFPVTEGEDLYIVSVGRRGEFRYSFDQLRSRGVQVHLGT